MSVEGGELAERGLAEHQEQGRRAQDGSDPSMPVWFWRWLAEHYGPDMSHIKQLSETVKKLNDDTIPTLTDSVDKLCKDNDTQAVLDTYIANFWKSKAAWFTIAGAIATALAAIGGFVLNVVRGTGHA